MTIGRPNTGLADQGLKKGGALRRFRPFSFALRGILGKPAV